MSHHPQKTGWFHGSKFSVKDIFTHNHNWDRFYLFHRGEIRRVEKEEVKKMVSYKGSDRCCFLYLCLECCEERKISLGCNSRLCSDCGKRYVDRDDIKHYKTMNLDDFIHAIIQHVPERQFEMIRYYGAYCRKGKSRYNR